MTRPLLGGILVLSAAFTTAGCSSEPKRYKVSGTVTYKGQPIPAGSILFKSEDPAVGTMGGSAINDGRYEIPQANGLLAGKYKVSISYPDPKGPAPKEGEAPGEGRETRELLPAKYNAATELTAEVRSDGDNVFSFDLK